MKINLLPPAPPLIRLRVQVLLAIMSLLIIGCLFSGVAYYTTLFELSGARSQIAVDQLTLQDLNRKSVIAGRLVADQAIDQQIVNVTQHSLLPAELLRSLLRDVAAYGYLESAAIAQNSLSVSASVKSYMAAGEFIRVLDHDPMLSQITVQSVSSGGTAQTSLAKNQNSGNSLLSSGSALIGSLFGGSNTAGNTAGNNGTSGILGNNALSGVQVQFTANAVLSGTTQTPSTRGNP